MRLEMSQQMKMDQRMVLAPRMIQSMEILQLPLLALQERIEQEMLSNPVLEQEEPYQEEQSDQADSPDSSENVSETPESEQSLLIKEDNSKKEDFERLDSIGSDYGDYLSRSEYVRAPRSSGERDGKLEAMQNTAAPSQSLNEYLHEQWAFIEAEPIVKKIGSVIIDFIEETGYLAVELETLAEHVREEVTPAQMEAALNLVQTLEPVGVGARNLTECLLIQLQSDADERRLEIDLVKNHLKDIEMNRFPVLVRKTGREMAEIKQALKVVSRLDPRPGMQIGRRAVQYVMPDIIVEYDEHNDTYSAYLRSGNTVNLRISDRYNSMVKRNSLPSDAKEFLKNNLRSARWLIESIEQRKTTLLRVVNHVLKTQREFFDRGPLYLKPLPMVEAAEALGIHVGTVSRAVSGKYMQTPTGIFPLRYFFTGGTETNTGESVSWDAVKAKLQEIIDGEDKKTPYNDDELVEQLARHGIKLARRTVAKYRGLLNIPPARRRRQYE